MLLFVFNIIFVWDTLAMFFMEAIKFDRSWTKQRLDQCQESCALVWTIPLTYHVPCGSEVGHLINRNSSPRIAAHYRDYWGVIQPWTWSGTKECGAEWQLESQLNSSSELSWTHTRFHLYPALCFLFWSIFHASESDLQNQKTFNYLESKEPENSKNQSCFVVFPHCRYPRHREVMRWFDYLTFERSQRIDPDLFSLL